MSDDRRRTYSLEEEDMGRYMVHGGAVIDVLTGNLLTEINKVPSGSNGASGGKIYSRYKSKFFNVPKGNPYRGIETSSDIQIGLDVSHNSSNSFIEWSQSSRYTSSISSYNFMYDLDTDYSLKVYPLSLVDLYTGELYTIVGRFSRHTQGFDTYYTCDDIGVYTMNENGILLSRTSYSFPTVTDYNHLFIYNKKWYYFKYTDSLYYLDMTSGETVELGTGGYGEGSVLT